MQFNKKNRPFFIISDFVVKIKHESINGVLFIDSRKAGTVICSLCVLTA